MLAITGVTGKLGGLVARNLSQKGIETRLLARRPDAVESLPQTTIYQAFYDTNQRTIEALMGVYTLFMVSAKESAHRIQEHKDLIDAAKMAGVRQIVYTSFYNARADSTFNLARDHAATEAYIREKGFSYTFIRDNFYLDFFVDLAREYGEIKGPAGQGKVSAVAREDVAQVASTILQNPQKWENQILNMTGPEELTLSEMTAQMSLAWGKETHFINETIEEAYASRKVWSTQDWEYDSWVSTYTAIAAGEQAGISQDIERLLGRPAKSLATFLKESN